MADAAKEILFEEEAREKLKKGINQLAKAVQSTLGPQGRNVGIEEGFGDPKITNDGWSIVQAMQLKDQYEDMGVSLGKELTSKMKDTCGDGTTTAIILLNALVINGIKNIAAGASPIHLKRGMEKAAEAVLVEIEKNAIPVQEDRAIENVAIVSASGNREIGKLIANAFTQSSVITIEEGKGTDTIVEVTEGMQFDRGYLSAYFCTEVEKRTATLKNAKIFITDKKISSAQDILPILQVIASTGEELLLIAEDFEGDALSTLVVNKLKGILKVCAVKAPAFGDRRKAILQDIAILTGATLVSEDTGMQLKDAGSEILGSAEKIEITKDHTTIIGGKGDAKGLQSRIQQIQNEITESKNSYDKEKLEERKANLSGGVAVIRVGASTEIEMKQKKQTFEDSLSSTRSAKEEGIVPGGGVALLRASLSISGSGLSTEEKIGAQILKEACLAPIKQIILNSGEDASLLIDEILQKDYSFGFNALSEQIENLLESGVIDPVKVVKNALQFATSIAGVILISEALIGDTPEEE